jgi:hypothetical protein
MPSGLAGDVPAQRSPTDSATGLAPLVPTGPPVVRARRTRWRTALVVVLAVAPLLFVAGIPFAFHSYDVATRPDRTAPDVTVQNYLQAFLADRDDVAASQFACADQSGLTAFKAFRADLIERERRLHVNYGFDWTPFVVTSEGSDAASVSTDLSIEQRVGTNVFTQGQTWDFRVDRGSGWRVCGAARTG